MEEIKYLLFIIGALITLITFSEKITRFKNYLVQLFSKKKQVEMKIVNKIIEYYDFFAENIDKENLENKYSKIESDIDFAFSNIKYELILKFNNRFIDKYMKYIGYKSDFRTKDNFYKFSHLYFKNTDLILSLSNKIFKSNINRLNFPLKDMWVQFRANRFIFDVQYKKMWEGVQEEDKIILSDIEMPIRLLKIYYNILI